MGKNDNRRTIKMKRRKSQRKMIERDKRKRIEKSNAKNGEL